MSQINQKSLVTSESRRKFVIKAAYVAPAVLSLQAASAFARVGSSTPVGVPSPSVEQLTPKP